MKLDQAILREWDIRGVYPEQINAEVAKALGYAFGVFLHTKNKSYCVVGQDNRFGGDELTKNLMFGLVDSGINIIYLGIVTTPMLNYASHKLKLEYGLMVTASHNPKNDNGFKLFGENYLHLNKADLTFVYEALKNNKQEITTTKGWIKKLDISDSYAEYLGQAFNFGSRPIKAVIDCGNGTAAVIIKKVYEKFNWETEFLFCDSDPNFPNHHPDPNTEANLKALKEKVLETKADLGIAYDGDGDRVGIIDEQGKMIEVDHLMAIFIRDILPKVNNKNFVLDVKCSQSLEEEITKLGGTPIMVKNGSAFVETFVYNYPVLFGGEFSGHLFFLDRHHGYDDGIYGGLRLQEILSTSSLKCSQLTEGINKYFNTPELRVKVSDDRKFAIVNQVKDYCISKNYQFLDIDGVRVKYSDGWALIRASNTGPNLTLRFEATTRERLAELLKEFTILINKLVK